MCDKDKAEIAALKAELARKCDDIKRQAEIIKADPQKLACIIAAFVMDPANKVDLLEVMECGHFLANLDDQRDVCVVCEALAQLVEAAKKISITADYSQTTFGSHEQYLRALTVKLNEIMTMADGIASTPTAKQSEEWLKQRDEDARLDSGPPLSGRQGETVMATMVTINCKWCQTPRQVRKADRARGWGLYCDKSCKAAYQTARTGRGRPKLGPGEFYAGGHGWDDHKAEADRE